MKKSKLIKLYVIVFCFVLIVINILSFVIIKIENNGNISFSDKDAENYGYSSEEYSQYMKDKAQLDLGYSSFDGWSTRPISSNYFNVDTNGHRRTLSFNNRDSIVLFLGGSVAWGYGNTDLTTIPSLVTKYSEKYNCINLGEVGFSSMQSAVGLLHHLNEYRNIAHVVSIDGVNDMYQYCVMNGDFTKHYREKAYDSRLRNYESNSRGYLLKNLFNAAYQIFFQNTVHLLKKVRNKYLGINSQINNALTCELNSGFYTEVSNRIIKNWRRMKYICDSENINFVSILQPNAFTSKLNSDHISHLLYMSLKDNYLEYYTELSPIIKNQGENWIHDFSSIFDTIPQAKYFIDDCHLNVKGNEIIAKSIIRLLQ